MPVPLKAVGGQAVIEGVMMRAAGGLSIAVRRSSGEIVVRQQFATTLGDKFSLLKLPFIRGVIVLFETVAMGFDALDFSAKQAEVKTSAPTAAGPSPAAPVLGGVSQREPSPPCGPPQPATPESPVGPADAAAADDGSTTVSSFSSGLTFAIAIILGVGLFVALPHGLSVLTGKLFGGFALSSPVFHLVAGSFKLGIFITYISLLSLLPDVRRVFMYHGAEHKVIATFEANEPLDVAHARAHTTFHARCGTSFLLVVVVASIVVFAILLPLVGLGEGWSSHVTAVAIKIPLLLPIAALAYEANRFAANHLSHPLVRLFVTPGFWLQRLTTREPTDDMLEVSIASLKSALRSYQVGGIGSSSQILVFHDFAAVQDGMG
jgi:uncharacterized protein YqhQ